MRHALASFIGMASALLLPGCQPGSAGPLDPVTGNGVTVEADRVALVTDGAVEARVSGQWSSMQNNSLTIRYRNAGNKPLRIALSGFKMEHLTDPADLLSAVDRTGVDMTDARNDNNEGKVLFSLEGYGGSIHLSATLDLPVGATRELHCDFTGFSDARQVTYGDPITATIPLGSRSAKVNFTAARAQWWIFW